MTTSMKVEDRLDGAKNFRAWKHRVTIILDEFDLLDYVEKDLPELEGNEEKKKFRKEHSKIKRILTESIKDNLIPFIYELKTPKTIFDALARLYKSKNTSRKLTLWNQLRITKISKSDTITTYFMNMLQIKDQLATITENIEGSELTTITLNGFPLTWSAFVQDICARKKLPKFYKLWEDGAQEEARILSISQDLEDEEDQTLVAHTRKGKKMSSSKFVGRIFSKTNKYFSNIRCYNCDMNGHYARDCTQKSNNSYKGKYKCKGKRKHHAHAAYDHEHNNKRFRVDSTSSLDEEFVFVSTLTGTITQESDVWLIGSGASKHMAGCRASLIEVKDKKKLLSSGRTW